MSGYNRFRTSTGGLRNRYSLLPGRFWHRVALNGTCTGG